MVQTVNSKNEEIESWRARFSDFEHARKRELEEWSNRYRSIEAEFTTLRSKYTELENKLVMISTENERLKGSLNQRNEEIDSWRTRYTRLEEQLRQQSGWEMELRRTKQIL